MPLTTQACNDWSSASSSEGMKGRRPSKRWEESPCKQVSPLISALLLPFLILISIGLMDLTGEIKNQSAAAAFPFPMYYVCIHACIYSFNWTESAQTNRQGRQTKQFTISWQSSASFFLLRSFYLWEWGENTKWNMSCALYRLVSISFVLFASVPMHRDATHNCSDEVGSTSYFGVLKVHFLNFSLANIYQTVT